MAARKTTTKKAVTKKPAKKETPLQKAQRLAKAAEAKAKAAEAKAAELENKTAELEKNQPETTVSVTIKHGISRQHKMDVPGSTTVGQIIQDPDIRAVLAYGENVKAIVNGRTISETTAVNDIGDDPVISIENQSNTKA